MDTPTNLWTFRLLTSLAHSDGIFDPAERQMLEDFANDIFNNGAEVQLALKGIESPESIESIVNLAPKQAKAQSYGFKTLALCIAIANADGDIHESERDFLIHLGKFYRFEVDMVELLIKTHIEQRRG